jgi:hydroxymethylbilane synthase
LEVERSSSVDQYETFGKTCALQLLEHGGKKLMESIKKEML